MHPGRVGSIPTPCTRKDRHGHPTELDGKKVGNRDPQRHVTRVTRVEHVGWEPGCECNAGEPAPAVVLDPFLGSGTTVAEAVRLGRRGIGCDLNPEYAEIARRRTAEAAGTGLLAPTP
ncbi:MAG TPA: DNA methyltransferase [Urbifossiella sp.]|nr:DNA methyltransferase [Urbifossiella sp.]